MSNDNEQLDQAIARLVKHGMSRRGALKAIVASGMGAAVSPVVTQLAWGAEGPVACPWPAPISRRRCP